MGLVIALVVLPVVFTILAVYVTVKVALLLLRLLFAPLVFALRQR